MDYKKISELIFDYDEAGDIAGESERPVASHFVFLKSTLEPDEPGFSSVV